MIETLKSKRIRDIACGSSHSAAITSNGELYTWGLGEYGRLGHGDNVTQLKPKLVSTLIAKKLWERKHNNNNLICVKQCEKVQSILYIGMEICKNR
jgi:alpha-tubulin suppressor-like RCC1 family protein